jgi:nucleoid-associated protein YgaU
MKQLVSGAKSLFFVAAVAAAGPLLYWVTAGSLAALTADDLDSMATAAAGAIAWTAYTWLVVATAATVLERVPGVVGRAAGGVAGSITSAGSRALLRSALGVAVTAPLTVGVAHAAAPGTGPADTGQRPWEQVEPASTVRISGPAERPRVAVPDRPTSGAATRYTEIRPAKPGTSPRRVVVRPGDSLWSIAAAELGPAASHERIAARWPRWYAANRHAIGPDPDLIQPGEVLRTPSPDRNDQQNKGN